MPLSFVFDMTSWRRDGSLRASWLDQMLPQGVAPVFPFHAVAAELLMGFHVGCSLEGVPGFEAVGLYGMVPDVLRFSVAVAVGTSLSQDVRRAGFWTLAA